MTFATLSHLRCVPDSSPAHAAVRVHLFSLHAALCLHELLKSATHVQCQTMLVVSDDYKELSQQPYGILAK